MTPGFYYHMHFFTMRPEDAVGGFICVDIIKKEIAVSPQRCTIR